MIKGTTPTHTFFLPFDTGMIKDARITYSQNGSVVLKKEAKNCAMEGNEVSVKLTQEDTMMFNEGVCVEVQVRVLTLAGDALASEIVRIGCDRILDDGVLE